MIRSLALLLMLSTTAIATPSKVLVLLAHPDDEVLMAGTLSMAVGAGHQVRAVYVTSGDAGQDRSGRGLEGAALAAVRERETHRSNRVLGFAAPPTFLSFPDGQVFAHRDRVRAAALDVAEDFDPDLIMTLGPDGVTGHPDHQATYLTARQVRDRLHRRPGFLAVVFTEARVGLFDDAWGLHAVRPEAVDHVVAVPTHLRRKRVEVLRLHHTQFPEAMVEGYRTRTLAEDGEETFQGDGRLEGVPGLEP
jgi:LmbE family N-acetylglucosaminyl deacetylase